MGLLSKLKQVFSSKRQGKEEDSAERIMEKKHDKAMELVEHGISKEAIMALDGLAQDAMMNPQYQKYGCEALKILGQVYETGRYENIATEVDREKAVTYYERYIQLVEDGSILYKLGLLELDMQKFDKAVKHLEQAAGQGVSQANMRLGDIYEKGLNKIDIHGNKGDFVIQPDFEKAKQWYKKLADRGDAKAKAALEQLEYRESHADSIEFEEKDKIYSEIAEKRKAKGIEPRYKPQDASKLQYQYTYVHDQVEGFIHKLPKDWVKSVDADSEEEYYAPSHTYKDFAIYVNYTTVPKDSEREIEDYLIYQNDAFEVELKISSYITEYASGISARFHHKELDKGIVTFAFKQKNRWACLRFVCSTMEIMEQYNEIIFEVANSFAFVKPTLLGERSANRTEIQYYNEALYYYNMDDYEKAMQNAKIALQNGSTKASYLFIELYYDEKSPYHDINRTISYAEQLFGSNQDPDLAFLIGNIYDQHLKKYQVAKEWYEKADKLKHKRVPFYLGRVYYYGLAGGKRDGRLALEYLKRAVENGIYDAEPYIKDIESLGDPSQLQNNISAWERAIQEGNADTAFKVAMYKKDQVFYLASEKEIEDAFAVAIKLGSVEAAYEYGAYCQIQENKEGYTGPIKSLDYFFKAYEAGYQDFSKEYMFQVVEHKIAQGVSEAERIRLYAAVAKKGSIPALKQVLASKSVLDQELRSLYENLKEVVREGDVDALSCMHMIEEKFKELLNPVESPSEKVIQNKFFRLQVPKSCTAMINDEGGTIKLADSIIEFAVAEMPVRVDTEEEYNKVFNLIFREYGEEDNSEILVANSRMVGSGMLTKKGTTNRYSILLISSKNQYLFKLSSNDRRELMNFKEQAMKIALTLVESGEIYVATGDRAGRNVGLTLLLSNTSNNGMLAISKDDDDDEGLVFM